MLILWDWRHKRVVASVRVKVTVNHVAFSPDALSIVTSGTSLKRFCYQKSLLFLASHSPQDPATSSFGTCPPSTLQPAARSSPVSKLPKCCSAATRTWSRRASAPALKAAATPCPTTVSSACSTTSVPSPNGSTSRSTLFFIELLLCVFCYLSRCAGVWCLIHQLQQQPHSVRMQRGYCAPL